MRSISVLFALASESESSTLLGELQRGGFRIPRHSLVRTREALRVALRQGEWDIVLAGFRNPGMPGLDTLAATREIRPRIPFIMVSDVPGEESAVAAIKAGASDYVSWDNLRRLAPAVDRETGRLPEDPSGAQVSCVDESAAKAQRMEIVGRLAGGIAHDFNNVLSVVSGYANLLQLKLARAGTHYREIVEIEKAVMRATALIRQLMTFSRRTPVHPQPLDLGSIVRDSLTMLRVMVGDEVAVETRLEPGIGSVLADRSQMEQVIMNLAINARDAMPRGGTLNIELASCRPGPDHFRPGERPGSGDFLRLAIRDTGNGMSQDTIGRIFEPFFSTKAEGLGTGLGLSTVHDIVYQAGGHIRVESELRKGTTFELYLPSHISADHGPDFSPAPDTAGQRGLDPRAPRGVETVLLVEDDADLRQLTRHLLTMEGYRVLDPATLKEALVYARARDTAIDLLLTDLMMPHMNGRELADSIHALRPNLKVLFMSGYGREGIPMFGESHGEANFLGKPFTPPQLLAKVRAALDAPQVEKQL